MMKGYIVSEGSLLLKDNGDNYAIGTCETMGIKAHINIPINLAKLIHLNNVRALIKGCLYYLLLSASNPVTIGPFVLWYDNGALRITDQYDAPSVKD